MTQHWLEWLEFYQEQLRELKSLSLNRYKIIRYEIGHQQLVIMAESDDAPISDNRTHRFITFVGVSYMQLIPYWNNEELRLVSPEEREKLLKQLHLDTNKGDTGLVFQAFIDNKNILIVCASIEISSTMPNFPSFFKSSGDL